MLVFNLFPYALQLLVLGDGSGVTTASARHASRKVMGLHLLLQRGGNMYAADCRAAGQALAVECDVHMPSFQAGVLIRTRFSD